MAELSEKIVPILREYDLSVRIYRVVWSQKPYPLLGACVCLGTRTQQEGNLMRYLFIVLALLGSVTAAYATPGTNQGNHAGEGQNDTNKASPNGK